MRLDGLLTIVIYLGWYNLMKRTAPFKTLSHGHTNKCLTPLIIHYTCKLKPDVCTVWCYVHESH